jgi:hypothetical protein
MDIMALINGEPVYHGGEFGEDDTPKGIRMTFQNHQASTNTPFLDSWPRSSGRDDFEVAQHSWNEATHLDIAPHTCIHCEKLCIDIRELASESWMRLKSWAFENGPDISITSPTGTTVYEAVRSASQGCAFWAALMHGSDYDINYFSNHLARSLPSDQYLKDGELSELYSDDDGKIMLSYVASKEAQPSIEFKLGRGPGQPTYLHIWVPPGKLRVETWFLSILTGYGLGGQPQSFLPSTLPPNLVPNSALSFYRTRKWIQECVDNHEDCNLAGPGEQDFMPKRVLGVKDGDNGPIVQLISNPEVAHFATLSYCWGGDQPAKTVKDKVAAYSANIPFHSLPQAIQDAVLVTVGTGIPYLWVDALCIVQDDDDDKADQILQMHRIYRCSYVTIAASVSSGSTEGFLHNRNQLQPLKVCGRLDDNVFSDLILSPVPELLTQEGVYYEASLPLFQRAWTFQETHLAKRIISYSHQGLMYRCQLSTHTEGIDNIEDIDIHYAIDPGNSQFNSIPHPHSWQAIMMAYAQRQLTVVSDKLLGIAAMAKGYARQKGTTEYYAGLWKEDFPSQLLWVTDSEEQFSGPRPKQYIAPSWSWASANRSLWMHGDSDGSDMLRDHLEESSIILDHFCVLLDAKMTLVDPKNRFGMVSAGEIRLSAKMKDLVLHVVRKSPSLKVIARDTLMTEDQCLSLWPQSGGYDARLSFELDYPDEIVDGAVYRAIEVCGVAAEGEDSDTDADERLAGRSYGLLLERAGHDTYRRLGVMTLARQDVWGWMFDIPESQEITII